MKVTHSHRKRREPNSRAVLTHPKAQDQEQDQDQRDGAKTPPRCWFAEAAEELATSPRFSVGRCHLSVVDVAIRVLTLAPLLVTVSVTVLFWL